MNNTQLQIKIRQRLNKLASNDFDNIECWQIVEAFNKAQLEWCRRQLRGSNQYKEGDEMSKRRIDDLQPLLREQGLLNPIQFGNQANQYNLPVNDYLEYKKVTVFTTKECCKHDAEFGRAMQVYLAEAANVNLLLRDPLRKPSYEWNETFATMQNNTIRIYHNGEFNIELALLQYYRLPVNVQLIGCTDPIGGGISTADVECEFKDDVAEVIVDDAVSILAGDVADVNNYMRGSQQAEKNN
tara:strand:+ start:149 stop:871 length:723 start_codon:yes stop_codon:yes gene_type:complete